MSFAGFFYEQNFRKNSIWSTDHFNALWGNLTFLWDSFNEMRTWCSVHSHSHTQVLRKLVYSSFVLWTPPWSQQDGMLWDCWLNGILVPHLVFQLYNNWLRGNRSVTLEKWWSGSCKLPHTWPNLMIKYERRWI